MPRISTYQPGQVGPVETTQARFRAPDMAPSGLGQGLQALGDATARYAQVQDAINAQNDDTQSRKMAAEAHQRMAAITQQFGALQGGNARAGQADAMSSLDKVRSDYIAQASNPRMAKMLEERLGLIYADNADTINGHALKQSNVEHEGALSATVDMNRDAAVSATDPAKRLGFVQAGSDAVNQYLDFKGIVDPAARALALRKFTSNVHRGVLDGELARPDRDVNFVAAYLGAHRDEMLDSDVLAIERDLQGPLKQQQAMVDVLGVTGEAKPSAPAPGSSSARMTAITADSESGNRDHNPDGSWVTSPKGAMGRMQVMPATARDPGYGIKPWDGKSADDLARVGVQKLDVLMKRYGDPAKAWAAYNWGEGNVDKAVREHGLQWLSAAPAETRDYVAKNTAALNGHDEAPREWNKDDLYNRIDAKAKAERWTLERTEAAKRYADTMVSRDEELKSRAEKAADEQAFAIVRGLGDGFTSVNQIPREVRNSLSIEAQARYDDLAKKNAAPKEAKPNGLDAMTLNIMRVAEPERFKALNLAEFWGKVSPAEMDTFLTKQAELRSAKEGAWSPSSGISSAVEYGKKIGGLKLNPEQTSAIMQTMESEANALHSAGKPVDFNALFQHATRNVRLTGLFGSSDTPLYNLTLSNMRDDQRQSLTAKFRREMGREPTDAELLRLYRIERR